MLKEIRVKTNAKTQFIDITRDVQKEIQISGISDGLCFLFVPHTTAAITINENADISVSKDIINFLNKIVPFDDNYLHLEGNSSAHIKSVLIGCSETIAINFNKLVLGTWQGIFFCEFDGPRTRKVQIHIS